MVLWICLIESLSWLMSFIRVYSGSMGFRYGYIWSVRIHAFLPCFLFSVSLIRKTFHFQGACDSVWCLKQGFVWIFLTSDLPTEGCTSNRTIRPLYQYVIDIYWLLFTIVNTPPSPQKSFASHGNWGSTRFYHIYPYLGSATVTSRHWFESICGC